MTRPVTLGTAMGGMATATGTAGGARARSSAGRCCYLANVALPWSINDP
jgi:hypothetical protein